MRRTKFELSLLFCLHIFVSCIFRFFHFLLHPCYNFLNWFLFHFKPNILTNSKWWISQLFLKPFVIAHTRQSSKRIIFLAPIFAHSMYKAGGTPAKEIAAVRCLVGGPTDNLYKQVLSHGAKYVAREIVLVSIQKFLITPLGYAKQQDWNSFEERAHTNKMHLSCWVLFYFSKVVSRSVTY